MKLPSERKSETVRENTEQKLQDCFTDRKYDCLSVAGNHRHLGGEQGVVPSDHHLDRVHSVAQLLLLGYLGRKVVLLQSYKHTKLNKLNTKVESYETLEIKTL